MIELDGKKVLITGGLGFIGSNLAKKFLSYGSKVTIFDCLDPRSGGNLYNVNEFKNSVNMQYYDILNFDQLVHSVVDKDIIVNCAASTSHPFSMKEPWIDLDVNSKGVINILEAIRRFNKDVKFVHIGTTTQLGQTQYQPADESHPEFPRDIYSANKSVSEKYVLVYAYAYGIKACVIRLSNVYGPRASIHSPEFTFNNYFIGLALQGKDINVFGSGEQKRNLIYVDDVVNAIILASQSEKANGETMFAVNDEHLSVAQIARTISESLGPNNVNFVDWPIGKKSVDVGDAIISNKKIKQLLGWSPKFDFISGLEETKIFYKTCLNHYLR
ncbi:MAG: NAD-dependent epimerase/dehydratase [Candidatus Magnetoglobus multicellularis str. Araruama]|uniref:NAD-dependent epimerase/dehydratase n=1 Tax=Candidatus Magnetoglobus multicellularis str. Araruama TaxID=890399 RepID=A0A1V1PAF8_9BACT|nr:MAG: NAD-dependent epimerase/dehydratase [Candidatus Magnetoglobus multicellularis str. Araruama]